MRCPFLCPYIRLTVGSPLRGTLSAGGASLPPAPPSPTAFRLRAGQIQRLSLRAAPEYCLWLPCVRGAIRRRAGLRGCRRVRGKGEGGSPSPISAPNQLFKLLRCFAWLIHDFAPSPMRALVFRSAYSASRNARASAAFAASIKAHRAVSSKTLMLQVRCAHPPMPHRTSSSSCSGVSVGLLS